MLHLALADSSSSRLQHMTRRVAVIATTHKLANGFQHTREDLDALAEGVRQRIAVDPFLNKNHFEGVAPIARQYDAYVAPFLRDGVEVPGEHALYITFEVLPGVDPDTVARFIERGGFSVAFFGTGIGHCPQFEPELNLRVGLPAEVISDIGEAESLLQELGDALPSASVEVRRYHEHALVSTATLVFVAGWVGGKIADKLFDKLWTAFETQGVKRWRDLVGRIKFAFDTKNGTVHAVFPAKGTTDQYERTLRGVVEEVIALENGTVRRRLAFMVTERWTLEKHEEPLPSPVSDRILPGE